MRVTTVTTSDRSLLKAVRDTVTSARHALLCVAFAQEKGVRLLETELKELRKRGASVHLLVTTTFAMTPDAALHLAHGMGVSIRVLNPGSGSTYHPKVYLARGDGAARAVIGSANLTGGLATNLEAGIELDGAPTDAPIARAWDWAEQLWNDARAVTWTPAIGGVAAAETIDPQLFGWLFAEVRREPLFLTLGRDPRKNRVVEITPSEVLVETKRSLEKSGGAASIPAWMLNIAWDRLRTLGTLSNVELLDMRVHRSSAICAMLARLPGVSVTTSGGIRLHWAAATSPNPSP